MIRFSAKLKAQSAAMPSVKIQRELFQGPNINNNSREDGEIDGEIDQ